MKIRITAVVTFDADTEDADTDLASDDVAHDLAMMKMATGMDLEEIVEWGPSE